MPRRQLDAAADGMLAQLRRPEFQPQLCEECGEVPPAVRSCYCEQCEADILEAEYVAMREADDDRRYPMY